MPVNTELVARLLQPINADAPSGADLRYDARVDAIKEARREDLDLPGVVNRKLADWPTVIAGTSKLLAEETKDLQLAAWLTEALLQREGVNGLAAGFGVLQGLLDQFWDTVHPLPEDDDIELRIGPVEWIGAKLTIPLRMVAFGPLGISFQDILSAREIPREADAEQESDKRTRRAEAVELGRVTPEAVDAATERVGKVAVRTVMADLDATMAALNALEKSSDERFGRDAPAFNAMRNSLDEMRRYAAGLLAAKLEADPDPDVPEEDADTDGAAGGAALDESGPLTAEPVSRADAAQRVGVVAKWLRAQDGANPAPYLLVRGFRWGELRVAAPDVDPKLLEAPPTAIRARLKALLLDGKWSDLLEQSEMLMATAPGRGWLDLQRYVLTACTHLGGSHDAVAAAIRSELRTLLGALPQLPRMTLMDDTPTANEETRAWLEADGLIPAPDAVETEDSEHPDSEPTDGADLLGDALQDDAAAAHQGGFSRGRAVRRPAVARPRDAFDVARGELAQGRPTRAIEVLMAELARDQSPRGRFVRQTQIAYVMVEAGLDAVAQPILQRLVETIDERTLEQWESGPLVAQPMALLCRVLDRTGGDENQRYELYLRICRLDPMQALALQSR
ncbi:MAG: type VI secretion system protein TssA [Gemmatimonadota bacterium]|nr:type VI secretion system protein TssA [Gemmatimonadota bacterium]MDQ8166503.1 type VI secretion system protein TssA [Gemmatimonadota bacterium]MDQ8172383.1 type VI secretion system protein TssA [Gemmatimonadota bacterium]